MALCRMLIGNLWATGTVTASSEADALPATNSQTPERTRQWRSLLGASQHLLCDLGSAQACDVIFLANLVRQNGGAVELYHGGSGASPGAYTLVATLPTQDAHTRLTSLPFASTAARHWKLQWTNPGASASAEVGYVGLGAAVPLARSCEPAVDLDRVDPSTEQASPDGQKSYTVRTGFFFGSLAFSFLSKADADRFHDSWLVVQRQIPFFFALDTTILLQQWLMRFEGNLRTRMDTGAQGVYYRVLFDWEEAR